jgi:flagellar FliJ protein
MTKASYARALTDIVSGKLDFSRIKLYREAYVNIDILIEEQKSEVAYCEKLVDEETAKMNEAMQQRKIHEKLREKAFKRFLDEVAYEENQMVDELVAYQYGVQGSNSTDERSTDS